MLHFDSGDKATGRPSAHLAKCVTETLPMLGRDPNDQRARTSLTDVVMRFIPDLIMMPPAPAHVRQALRPVVPMWEATIKRGDKVVVSFKYSREIDLAGPAYLVYRFQESVQ